MMELSSISELSSNQQGNIENKHVNIKKHAYAINLVHVMKYISIL